MRGRAEARVEFGNQVVDQRVEVGVVEQDRHRKLKTKASLQPVAHVDREQRVDAQVRERRARVDVVRRSKAEHARKFRGEHLPNARGACAGGDRLPIDARFGFLQRRVGARLGIERFEQRRAFAAREVARPIDREHADGGVVPGRFEQARHGGHRDVRAERANPGAFERFGRPDARRHAAARPRAPRDAGRDAALRAAPRGKRIEPGVGGRVVRLARRAHHRRHRRVQHKKVELVRARELIEKHGALPLGAHHIHHARPRHVAEQTVVERAGGVGDAAQGQAQRRECGRDLLAVGDVEAERAELGLRRGLAQGDEAFLRGLVGRGARAEHDFPRAAFAEPFGKVQAERAEAAGDQVAGVLVHKGRRGVARRRRQHQLADVARLGQVAKRTVRVARVEHARGKGRIVLGLKSLVELVHQRALQTRIRGEHVRQVKHVVRDIGSLRAHLLGGPNAQLAELDKASALGERTETGRNVIARHAVEHDVDTAPARHREHARGVRGVARVEHKLDALALERRPLTVAGRRDDARAALLGELNRRLADAARGRVDQDPLARLQLGDAIEAVQHGHPHRRQARRLGHRQARRHAYGKLGGHVDVARHRAGRAAHHGVTECKRFAGGAANGDDAPGTLEAKRLIEAAMNARQLLEHAQREQHVFEVQRSGLDRDLDFIRQERRRFRRDKTEPVEAAVLLNRQAITRCVRQREACALLRGTRFEARDVALAFAKGNLAFGAVAEHFAKRVGEVRAQRVEVDRRPPKAGFLERGRARQAPNRSARRIDDLHGRTTSHKPKARPRRAQALGRLQNALG